MSDSLGYLLRLDPLLILYQLFLITNSGLSTRLLSLALCQSQTAADHSTTSSVTQSIHQHPHKNMSKSAPLRTESNSAIIKDSRFQQDLIELFSNVSSDEEMEDCCQY